MIGHIDFNVSFQYSIGYCLEDKKQTQRQTQGQTQSQTQRQTEGQTPEVAYRNRAEVLYYNQCFGDKRELIQQFEEVQKLNRNIVKPVLHLSLSAAPKDEISKSRWVDLARD
ncbi:MAG TPA: hypothetical protein VKQ52_03025, partial [Puia sp.]|nr:hypothetical protein [Puia sp.]